MRRALLTFRAARGIIKKRKSPPAERKTMEKTKILFVCHGNICRSPMAEYRLKDLVRRANAENRFQIDSAAVSSEEEGNPVYPPARRKLAEHGISCAGKTARRIEKSDYDEYDLIIGMDADNLRRMRAFFGGDPRRKLGLLLDHTPHPRDVADPWYTGDFESCWRDIDAGCRDLFARLTGKEK